MEYRIQTPEFILQCRVKKRSLICKNSYIYVKFGYGNETLFLEECRIQTGRTYADIFTPQFTEWVRTILDTCCTMAFYCFPDASEVQMEYVWSIVYSQVEPAVNWSLGTQTVHSQDLEQLKGKIVVENSDCENDWEPPEWDPSPHQVMMIYS